MLIFLRSLIATAVINALLERLVSAVYSPTLKAALLMGKILLARTSDEGAKDSFILLL
jgi:hypothetical protein